MAGPQLESAGLERPADVTAPGAAFAAYHAGTSLRGEAARYVLEPPTSIASLPPPPMSILRGRACCDTGIVIVSTPLS
jgi:hypothetical protein